MENHDITEKRETTEIVFILDRSGSMAGLEKDTIGGFNSMINKQKDELKGMAIVSTVIFDTEIETIHDMLDISSVPVLTDKEYYARGGTALLDAVGLTITRTTERQKNSVSKPSRTLFVITTDGYENSSKEYTYKTVKNLIESKKKENWDFLFLGANIDAIGEASKIGIEMNRAANYCYDSEGIQLNYESVGKIMKCCCHHDLSDDCLEDIKMDYRKRSKKH